MRDPYKFPDFIRTQKGYPKTSVRGATAMWDFWPLSPESLHQVTILFCDSRLPKSERHMNGYGSHTYSLIDAADARCRVEFHLKTIQGIATLTNPEGGNRRRRPREPPDRSCSRRSNTPTTRNGGSASRSCPRRMPRRRPTTPSN